MTHYAICPQCLKARQRFQQGICLCCHSRKLIVQTLDKLESGIKPASDYNRLLFNLYLSYVRKCQLEYRYANQATRLKEVLEREQIPGITSWADIDRLTNKYQIWDRPKHKTGCAFKKIGRMLNGLGILEVSWKYGRSGRRQAKVMELLASETAAVVSNFSKMLIKQNRSQRTVVVYLERIHKFEKWLQGITPDHGVMLAGEKDIEFYLDHLHEKKHSANQVYGHYTSLNKFYRWCVVEKKLLLNPAKSVKVAQPSRSFEVCSEADLKTIIAYVKNSRTPPLDAFLISLVLFFGFTIEQLCLAQLAPKNGESMRIILSAHANTFGARHKRPADQFDLPASPVWFSRLQQRYYNYWCERYKDTKQISVRRPLFLRTNKWHNTPIDSITIGERLQRATTAALGGEAISWRVLHNTCGVLYTRFQDASLLSQLGWSRKYTSNFVYLTKKFHTRSTKN